MTARDRYPKNVAHSSVDRYLMKCSKKVFSFFNSYLSSFFPVSKDAIYSLRCNSYKVNFYVQIYL